jgi:predicted RNA polymerase sigma factor
VQAAIQAVHCDAPSDEATDWPQILALYDILMPMVPTDAVRTARIVALTRVQGPEAALEEFPEDASADRYALAVRADLLERVGDRDRARKLFLAAAEQATNDAERAHLIRRAGSSTETQD